MRYKDGKKHFWIEKSVPYSIVNGHLVRLRQIFNSLHNDIIGLKSRTNIKTHKTSRACHAVFTVDYGIRMANHEVLASIIKGIACTSLLLLKAEVSQDAADKATESLKSEYKNYEKNKPQLEF